MSLFINRLPHYRYIFFKYSSPHKILGLVLNTETILNAMQQWHTLPTSSMTCKSRSPLLLGHCSHQLHKSCTVVYMVYLQAECVFILEHYLISKSSAAVFKTFSNVYTNKEVPTICQNRKEEAFVFKKVVDICCKAVLQVMVASYILNSTCSVLTSQMHMTTTLIMMELGSIKMGSLQ